MPPTSTAAITHQEIALDDWVWIRAGTWSDHKLGVNYGARITLNSQGPDGIQRDWLPKDKHKPGIVLRDLAPGDAFEIGSTTIDDKRTAVKHRIYGVVLYVDKTRFVYDQEESAKAAIARGDSDTLTLPGKSGPIPFIQRQIRNIDAQVAELHRQRAELLAQAGVLVKEGADHMDITEDDRLIQNVTDGLTPLPVNEIDASNLPLRKLILQTTEEGNDGDEEDLTPAQIEAMKKLLG